MKPHKNNNTMILPSKITNDLNKQNSEYKYNY